MSASEKYVVLITTPGGVTRVFGPWVSAERAFAFRDRVNANIDAIEERNKTARGRYGRAQIRALAGKGIIEATKVATDGLTS